MNCDMAVTGPDLEGHWKSHRIMATEWYIVNHGYSPAFEKMRLI